MAPDPTLRSTDGHLEVTGFYRAYILVWHCVLLTDTFILQALCLSPVMTWISRCFLTSVLGLLGSFSIIFWILDCKKVILHYFYTHDTDWKEFFSCHDSNCIVLSSSHDSDCNFFFSCLDSDCMVIFFSHDSDCMVLFFSHDSDCNLILFLSWLRLHGAFLQSWLRLQFNFFLSWLRLQGAFL